MIHARRKDRTHNEIKAALEACGCYVLDLYQIPGCLDMLVACRGRLVLLEVKDGERPPSERKVTPKEQAVIDAVGARGAPVFVVISVEDARRVMGV